LRRFSQRTTDSSPYLFFIYFSAIFDNMSVELSIGDILEEREDNSQSSIKGALEEHYDDDVERSEMWYRSGETVRLYDLGMRQ